LDLPARLETYDEAYDLAVLRHGHKPVTVSFVEAAFAFSQFRYFESQFVFVHG
jgi:hypothetical protein